MKLILLQDVKSLGKKGDIIEANDGYARNFLLPKKMAAPADNKNLNDLKLQKSNEVKVAAQLLADAQAFASELENKEITVQMKAGEGGRTFGAVSSKEIASSFKEQCGIDIDKKKIQLSESIKSFGTFNVPVKLHPKVMGNLKVKVVEK